MSKLQLYVDVYKEYVIVCITKPEAIDAFKTLIQRGIQTWTDAPAEIKELADLITNGQIMQPYSSLSSEKKLPE